ncbi:hypothetical protein F4561_001476 [Lipingzhangella halophila]|uniref:Suppressor of fused protein SUFU n=1 Tax=Lipingzhangella halophila TaxID=1783352 RepID=A0A7W7RFU8_9ACTN|nr:hypothetical protein [Lipingzhangella halophila]MBB4930656.1 hypothetical protein [Lipingzhangella halophila]
MSFPRSDPALFEGLFEHVERYLGPYVSGTSATMPGYNRGFGVSVHRHTTLELVSAATMGVRFQEVDSALPEEFACSVLPGQDAEAAYLVHVAAERVIQTGRGYEFGHGYVNAEPLIPDSRIDCLLMEPNLWVDAAFTHFSGDQAEPVLRFVTVLPAMCVELDALERGHDHAGQMRRMAAAAGVDLRDIYRAPAIGGR